MRTLNSLSISEYCGKGGEITNKGKLRSKVAYILKHNKVLLTIYKTIMSAAIKTLGIFVKRDDFLALFVSYSGKKFDDSPRVLFEAMKADQRFKGFHFVWAFEEPTKFKIENADTVRIDSLKYFITALKAKIWITNVNIERGLNFKKKGTIFLNSWHGTGPKKNGNAIKTRNDYDFSNVDIFCCDGEYTKSHFVKWFNVRESSMLWCGRPREDELFEFTDADTIRIRKKLNIPDEKQVLLYMPTWRDYKNSDADYSLWEKRLCDKYVLLCRTHHFDIKVKSVENSNGFFIDVTTYPDVNELYWVADILISDYSSAFFDFGLLGKPMFCFANDYDKFASITGLFIDLRSEFPNGIMESDEDLISAICKMDYDKECQKVKQYVAKYVSHPVNATQACLDRMYELLCKKLS